MFVRKSKVRKLLNLTRQMLNDYKWLEAENKRLEQENAGLAEALYVLSTYLGEGREDA